MPDRYDSGVRLMNPKPAYDLTYDDVFMAPRRSSVTSRLDVDLTSTDSLQLPLPLVVAVNYCGIPTVTPAQLAGIVAHMVSVGADPEVKDAQGQNLFDRAKYACPPEVMKALGG